MTEAILKAVLWMVTVNAIINLLLLLNAIRLGSRFKIDEFILALFWGWQLILSSLLKNPDKHTKE